MGKSLREFVWALANLAKLTSFRTETLIESLGLHSFQNAANKVNSSVK